MELLDSDFGNSHNSHYEDFDSGCSCLPSSPSNCSDFSCSSLDNFGEDWTIRRGDAIKMGQSFLDGGPVLNPFISIKADNDIDEYRTDTLLIPDNFPDLLDGAVTSCTQVDYFDHSLADLSKNETNSSLDILTDESFYDTAINITPSIVKKCEPESTESELSRKRNYSESDHTYASNTQRPTESVSVKKKKPTSNSNSKDEKYWEKRQKNNLAAKRSREMKRSREIELVKKSTLLEKENADLMKQMEKLKKLVHKLEMKLER
ncbi:thyrotroph embryonic factor-like [Actinia tenebrosa]|uniref:Thyrotroph embryonic factor-like n=1 Tax=Actinia tenebrosa TaxID=6105 RepID=A0A6P8J2L2_ACTTE|nr:thyrotroph embryonic factor-like [Actinia tenebrosa]